MLAIGATRVRELGPDVLAPEVETAAIVARLRRADPSQLVGEALVDQRLVAGIGNMWLAEMLWHARVSPWARLGEAPDEKLIVALDWVRTAMAASVAGRRPSRAVYRCAGRSCLRCGEVIRAGGLGDANRTAYWCPNCQSEKEFSGGGGI